MNFIDVSENFLTGTIPPDMCKKGTMTQLLMLQNKLTGDIPANYAKCTTLTRFRVNNNSLSGVVPAGLWGLPNVTIIDLTSNQFEGPITSDIGNAKKLAQFLVSYNRLSGELPDELSETTSLVSVVLNNNQFSGKIPAKVGDLKQLSTLYLQSNLLSSSIPKSLGSCSFLSDLNMANNSLSGEIPSSLGSLPTLNSLDLSHNELSGKIPESLASLRLSMFDLSHNRLTGAVPKSLSIAAYNGSLSGNPGLCSMDITYFPRCSPEKEMSDDVRTLIICFSVGTAILFVSLIGFVFLKRKEKDQDRSLKEESWDVKSFHVITFSEDEILDSITQENLIGKGGSGNVYKVSLSNGKDLAVKHIWNTDPSGRKMLKSSTPMLGGRRRSSGSKSKEFDAEVQTLSSIRHVNVVKLFCSITSEDSSLLVYEYLPNGSLWDRLHMCEKMKLDWDTRYEIAVGAAKGLEYLHHSCERLVIHRDVKSSNILLDEFLKPRIADFGLAKIVQTNGINDSTHVVAGTHGYIAPEYGYTYKVNEKSDVYSFGVVLMELVTGKKPIDPSFGDNKDIVNWICDNLKCRESVLGVVDSYIPEAYREEAIKVLRIAILCTARLPELRPSMRSVVQMLEEAHEPMKLLGIVISKDGSSKKMEVQKGTEKLMEIFKEYCKASGQLINGEKSSAYFSPNTPDQMSRLLGKEILIKSVATAIPAYPMACFKFPKGVCDTINSALSNFWWGSTSKGNQIHWKSWELLGKTKEEGGLGFRDLHQFNMSLLAKQCWRLVEEPNSLWASVLKAKYFPNCGFLEATKGYRASWSWASLIEARDLVFQGCCWQVVNGKSIQIWYDSWIPPPSMGGGILIDGALPPSSPQLVHSLIDWDTHTWRLDGVANVLSREAEDRIRCIPIGEEDGNDRLLWPWSKNGSFTVKSGYHWVHQQSSINASPLVITGTSHRVGKKMWRLLWGMPTLPKVKLFFWQVIGGVGPNFSNLYKRKLTSSPMCPLCGLEDETFEHLLLLCSWVSLIWFGSPMGLRIDKQQVTTVESWFINSYSSIVGTKQKEFFLTMSSMICWMIWKARCNYLYKGIPVSPQSTLHLAINLAMEFMEAKATQLQTTDSCFSPRVTSKRWVVPPLQYLKINCDASWNPSLNVGLGIVIRDHSGALVGGASMRIRCSSPKIAEAEAILLGASTAASNM
ncbi:hypothetical protein ACLB2K_045877 [Fragaria x ananassa]